MSKMLRLLALATLGCATALTAACTPETPADDDDAPVINTTVELQDIFIPERLIEIPVLPAGTVVVNEVFVHNAGDRDLAVHEISLDYQSDDNWSLELETVPPIIAAHDHVVVKVRYVADDSEDTYAVLKVYTDDPDEGEKTVAFIGRQATGGPRARVSENILDWGFQYRGVEKRKILELRNSGDEPMQITNIELVQSEQQVSFWVACPGQPLEVCDWETEVLPQLLETPIVPGSAALLELAFIPLNLQAVSGQLRISTTDPLHPQFTTVLLGNGESALNCTPPSIQIVSPSEATFYHEWQVLEVVARVFDQEQPPDSMYIEMFLGEQLIEDEFPDENGFVTFSIDIDDHNPPLPSGLQPFEFRVTDGCPLFGYATFTAAIEFPLSNNDLDGDGFDSNQGDCNDNDRDIFPNGLELLDGKDNDCDGNIDEGTRVWDDDCDGFCEDDSRCEGQGPAPSIDVQCTGLAAEPYGDCNDSVADLNGDGIVDGVVISPVAAESLNFVDDNCNGITDESTSFYDDDGDGMTEAEGDCDDDDDTIFSGAEEWCNGIDNDCNGTLDDDCRDPAEPPRVLAVIPERFQVGLDGRTRVQAIVVSPDPNLTYVWTTDRGGFDEPAEGATVFWNAPLAEDEDSDTHLSQFANLVLNVTTSDGEQSAFGFGTVLITQEVQTTYAAIAPPTTGGCSAASPRGNTGLLALLLVSLFGAVRLRRRA